MLIHPSWQKYLGPEFEKPYMKDLLRFLKSEKASGKIIFPSEENIFAAFEYTPFESVRVVILGQDPYHGAGQAHGLSFSVEQGIRLPPSLVNIYKELQNDVGKPPLENGSLIHWAKQGVLLLNSVLTVEEGKAASHHKKGWEQFTDKVIEVLNHEKKHLVFILWGAPAQKKAAQVDEQKHLLIKSPHPSPLSSYRGFFGSKPFSKTNAYLKAHHQNPINW
jgi:uracil-DNA glycosylase